MGEILSQAEVDAILAAIEPSRPAVRPLTETLVPQQGSWKSHDFRSSDPLHGAAMKVVIAFHEGLCQRWKRRLDSLLQSSTDIRPVGACRSSTTEFLASLTTRHVRCMINHGGSAAQSQLIWNAELVRSLIATMLGGTGGAGPSATNSAMTAIELRLLSRLNDIVLSELAQLLDEPLNVITVSENDDGVDNQSSLFPSIWFSFEVAGCGTSGLIHLGVPGASWNRSMDVTVQTPARPDFAVESVPSGIQHVSVQVTANLATLKLKTSELAGLQVGDVVMTDLSPSESVSLELDGRKLCQATIGTHLGRKALRLAEPSNR